MDADFEQTLAAPGLQQVSIEPGQSLDEAAIALRANPAVEFVSLPGTWRANDLPDPYYNDAYLWTQWSLRNSGQAFACEIYVGPSVDPFCPNANTRPLAGIAAADINAPGGWDIANTGSETVGVVDTGVAYQHEDLAPNIYVNASESGGVETVDDDGNTMVDDVRGWDFYDNDADPRDLDGHGTHVAGILGAASDNLTGIAGVDPRAKIMPLRAAGATGSFTWAAIEQAVTYGVQQGVRVFNGSFGGPDADPAFQAIIDANPQALFIFSAGNGGADKLGDDHQSTADYGSGGVPDGIPDDGHDTVGDHHQYPCDVPSENVICVAATDWNDNLAKFSDYGYDSVDIAAPGAAIFSSTPYKKAYCIGSSPPPDCSDNPADHVNDGLTGGIGDFKYLNGTSMAAPQVSGAAALIWGANPTLEASQIKTLLVTNTDQLPSLAGKIGFGGRLNVGKAAAAAADPPAPGWPATPPNTNTGSGGGSAPEPPTNVAPDPPVTTDTTPPAFSVVKPKSARVNAALGLIRFRVHCKEACGVKVLARVNIVGSKSIKQRVKIRANRSKTVSVRFRGKKLREIRELLAQSQPVKVFFSVLVTDTAGNKSGPRLFTVKLR